MKTLLNSRDKQEILARLESIRPESPRLWGRMSAHQMVCHVADGFRLYMGMITVAASGFPYPSRLLRFGALWVPIPWPRGFKTPTELDQQIAGTAPLEFSRDVVELGKLIERFTSQPRDFQWPSHPYLGRMSEREWMRLGYLHTDHHLRQFGA